MQNKGNGRKIRVVLTKPQRRSVRADYIQRCDEKGIVNNLSLDYNVSRKVISEIINSVKKLQQQAKVTDRKKRELEDETNRKIITTKIIDTLDERTDLIELLKGSQIVPIAKKIDDGKTLTKVEKIDLQRVIKTLEILFSGIDNIHKVDLHFHSNKILTVIQNMSADEGKILYPQLKEQLCDQCPLMAKYKKES